MNSRDGKCDGSNLFFLCISLMFYFTKLTGYFFFHLCLGIHNRTVHRIPYLVYKQVINE